MIENEKDYKVELAAPGMTKNDFKVSVDAVSYTHLWFVDSVTILPYMLTYMYWDTNIVHVIILLYIFIIVK